MKKLLCCFICLLSAITCFNTCEAKQTVDNKKKPKDHFVDKRNDKPSEGKKVILNLNEIERKIFDGSDSGDGFGGFRWKQLNIGYAIELDNGKKIDLTIVWKSNEYVYNPLEDLYNSFYLDQGDEIEFKIRSGIEWNFDYGNRLDFKIFRDGVSLGEFGGYYKTPQSNNSWDL